MSFIKKLFGGKDKEKSFGYQDFWKWFTLHEKSFFKAIGDRSAIERDFFDKLSSQLKKLGEGYYFLAGMMNDTTAELIFTAEGDVKKFVFMEDLVHAAPHIEGWKFTALKPALAIPDFGIKMHGMDFNEKNIGFYSNEHGDFPDEIDISFIYDHWLDNKKNEISQGVLIFLDNYLGELNFASQIDHFNVIGKNDAKKELIPISKLKDFLIWWEKEFIEKYEGVKINTEAGNYSVMEGELENGNMLIAVINMDLLNWDSQASHPWMLRIGIKFDGSKHHGLPDDKTMNMMQEMEDALLFQLKDAEGYLNIGRQSGNNMREIYFACKDFRKPSRVMSEMQKRYSGKLQMTYEIYRDKYWRSLDRFKPEKNM